MVHQILGQHLELLADKAIFWQEKKAILLSDLHLGKAGHFRKAGVPISSHLHVEEIFKLDALINRYAPESIYFLGDLFHSDRNAEWEMVSSWSTNYPDIKKYLILGNHDFLPEHLYRNADFIVSEERWEPPFLLTHEEKNNQDRYNISGHIHPGVSLVGAGRQSFQLPCFMFRKKNAYLPAFGTFTGVHRVTPNSEDHVYVVAEDQVINVT